MKDDCIGMKDDLEMIVSIWKMTVSKWMMTVSIWDILSLWRPTSTSISNANDDDGNKDDELDRRVGNDTYCSPR